MIDTPPSCVSQPLTVQMEKDATKKIPETPETYKVGVKVPPFWPDRPSLWFAQLEGQFILSGITSDTTKFYTACSYLDHQYAIEVADIIENPPRENKYDRLKTELIKRLSAPREEKILQFLNKEEMGSRKPSQFLRHLRHLAGSQITDEFIRTVWYNGLPQNIQPIIASQADTPLEQLADLADKIIAIAVPSPHVAEVRPSTSHASDMHIMMMEGMARQIAELTKRIDDLTTRQSRPRGRRYNNRSQSRSRSRSTGFCYYHRKFGANARKCTTPCQYKTAENYNGSH